MLNSKGSQIWLDFVGVVESKADSVRLRGVDGGVVEFDRDDVQISGNLISVRLDADARLIEAKPAASVSRTATTSIGLVLFTCQPFKPINICFDVSDGQAVAAV